MTWVNGATLAATAKHRPDQLDADDVRYAGHIVERYERLLASVVEWRRMGDGTVEIVAHVDADVGFDILGDMVDSGA